MAFWCQTGHTWVHERNVVTCIPRTQDISIVHVYNDHSSHSTIIHVQNMFDFVSLSYINARYIVHKVYLAIHTDLCLHINTLMPDISTTQIRNFRFNYSVVSACLKLANIAFNRTIPYHMYLNVRI